jgi:hypothetical protein
MANSKAGTAQSRQRHWIQIRSEGADITLVHTCTYVHMFSMERPRAHQPSPADEPPERHAPVAGGAGRDAHSFRQERPVKDVHTRSNGRKPAGIYGGCSLEYRFQSLTDSRQTILQEGGLPSLARGSCLRKIANPSASLHLVRLLIIPGTIIGVICGHRPGWLGVSRAPPYQLNSLPRRGRSTTGTGQTVLQEGVCRVSPYTSQGAGPQHWALRRCGVVRHLGSWVGFECCVSNLSYRGINGPLNGLNIAIF